MFKSLRQRFARSLSRQLTAPALLMGVLTLLILIAVQGFIYHVALQGRNQNEAQTIFDTLAIAAELDSTQETLQRVVFNLGANLHVKRLLIINGQTQQIVSDNLLYRNTDTLETTLDAKQLRALERFRASGYTEGRHQYGSLETHFHSLPLYDPQQNRLRQYWVMLTLDTASNIRFARIFVFSVISIFTLGLIVTLLGTLWLQQRRLIKPLLNFAARVKHANDPQQLVLLEHNRQDELGQLADAYNDLVKANQQKHRELSDYAQELMAAKELADVASEAKSNFLASMSHEIRTPLNGVLGMLQLLEKSPHDEDQAHKIAIAKSSGEALLSLINDILDFSKIEADKLELEQSDFDVRQMLASVAETIAPQAQQKGVEIIVDVADIQPPVIQGDITRIRQIVTNLASNAIKFTEQGEVVIRGSLTPMNNNSAQLHIDVSDTGIGIPTEKISELFDSFTQVDASTTRQYGGTGLGLAITKRLCELMHGAISVTSTPGAGSCFTATLQVQVSDIEPIDLPALPALHALVISDNPSLTSVLSKQLTQWQAARVLSGNQLPECETELTSLLPLTPPLVVLLDEQWLDCHPQYNARFASAPWQHCHIVLLQTFQALTSCDTWQPNRRLSKPVNPEKLHQCLQQLLNDSHNEPVGKEPTMEPRGNPALLQCQLLLVEDNPINQEVVIGLLEMLSIEPMVADNGQKALELLDQGQCFDLILMDCQMPVMDGYQATAAIRQGQPHWRQHSAVPIIALTANTVAGDRERCLAAGMSDHLPKPVDFDALQAALERWLQVSV